MSKKKPQLSKEEKQFYAECFDKNNNLIDYFLEVGINPKEIEQDYFFNEDMEIFKEGIGLKAEKISVFPEYNKKAMMLSAESLVNHMFPVKFDISTSPKPEEKFSIILDNQLSSATFLQKYITCLIFYEPYEKYIQLSEKCFKSEVEDEVKRRNLYIPKCICFASVHPFLEYHAKILDHVYTMYKENKPKCYINKVIEKLLTEVPYPPRAIKKYNLQIDDDFSLLLENKRLCDLPLININLKKVIDKFDPEDLLNVLKSILFEKKVVLISADKNFLTNTILAFISLIFPLKYQFQISSILPKDYYDLLENVTPFIFGINEADFKWKQNDYKDIYFIIDGNKKVTLSENFYDEEDKENFPETPKHLKKPFLEAISKLKTDDNEKIREIFFNFMLGVLENYNKYLKNDYMKCHETKKIQVMINLDAYLSSFKSDAPFFKKLSNTQIFIELLYQRLTPRNPLDKLELLLFEEKMIEKTPKSFFSKKPSLHLVGTNEFDFAKEPEIIKINSKDLSKKEVEFFKSDKVYKKYLFKGVEITAKDDIKFNYILFPALRTKYFYENKEEFKIPESLDNTILSKSKDILAKSHLSELGKEINITETENKIYESYIYLWALLYHGMDEEEKMYQFLQLMKVINNTISLDVNVLELLFRNLNTFGREDLIMVVYKKIVEKEYTQTSEIFDIVNNIVNKRKKKKVKVPELTYQNIYDENKDYQPFKRTFRSINENQILTEDVLFKAFYRCNNEECGQINNLYKASKEEIEKGNKEKREGRNWLKCSTCKKVIPAYLEIRFGLELFNDCPDKLSGESSSSKTKVELLSPDVLKEEILNMSMAQNENKTVEILLLDTFKRDNPVIFWNCVWYFKLLNLDISFILLKDKLEAQFSLKEDFQFVKNENCAKFVNPIRVEKGESELIEQQIIGLHICPFIGTIDEGKNEGEAKNYEGTPEEAWNKNQEEDKDNTGTMYNESVADDNQTDDYASKIFETLPDEGN